MWTLPANGNYIIDYRTGDGFKNALPLSATVA